MKSLHVICLLRILNDQFAYWIDFSAVCSAVWNLILCRFWSIDRELNQCSIDCLEFTDHPGYLVVKWRMRKFSVHWKSTLENFRFLRVWAIVCHYLNRDYIRLWQSQMKDKCIKLWLRIYNWIICSYFNPCIPNLIFLFSLINYDIKKMKLIN